MNILNVLKNMYTTNISGEKLSKNDPLIHLVGALDELNAHLGLIKATAEEGRDFIESIQIIITKIMAHVSALGNEIFFIAESEIAILRKRIADMQPYCPDDFILPGKSVLEAQIHIARTVARRAERDFAAAVEGGKPLHPQAGEYLNSLSGFLFALACKIKNA